MIIQWPLRVHMKPDNWHPQGTWLVIIQSFHFFVCAVMPVFPIWRKSDQDKTEIQNLEDWIHTCLNYGFLLKISQHMDWASNFISIILRLIWESSLSCVKPWTPTKSITQCKHSKSEYDVSMLTSGYLCSIIMKNISVVFFWNVPEKMHSVLFKAAYSFHFFLLNYQTPEKVCAVPVVFNTTAVCFCYWPAKKLFSILKYFFSKDKGRCCLLLLWAN